LAARAGIGRGAGADRRRRVRNRHTDVRSFGARRDKHDGEQYESCYQSLMTFGKIMPNEIMHIASFTMNKAFFCGVISLNGTPRIFDIPTS
jgi:hypothetical protein